MDIGGAAVRKWQDQISSHDRADSRAYNLGLSRAMEALLIAGERVRGCGAGGWSVWELVTFLILESHQQLKTTPRPTCISTAVSIRCPDTERVDLGGGQRVVSTACFKSPASIVDQQSPSLISSTFQHEDCNHNTSSWSLLGRKTTAMRRRRSSGSAYLTSRSVG